MTDSGISGPQPAGGGKGSELSRRVASAAALGAAAVAATWYGGLPFALLWVVASACVVSEWLALIGPVAARTGGAGANRLQALRLGAAAMMAALPVLALLRWPMAAVAAAAVLLAAGWAMLARRFGSADGHWRETFGDRLVVWTLAGLVLAAVIGLVPVWARLLPQIGTAVVAWMFAVVWTTDIAAYFTGRAIGGPKLWPRVSPNKTWAGFWGGAIGGALAGWGVWLIGDALAGTGLADGGTVLALSFLASLVGQGGDLAASALKRRAGVKDYGRIIPGHGGVLDRLDSFLAVCLLVGIGLASGALAAL